MCSVMLKILNQQKLEEFEVNLKLATLFQNVKQKFLPSNLFRLMIQIETNTIVF